jgi:hypothetical protein
MGESFGRVLRKSARNFFWGMQISKVRELPASSSDSRGQKVSKGCASPGWVFAGQKIVSCAAMMMDFFDPWIGMPDKKRISSYTRGRRVKVLDVFWGNPRGIIFGGVSQQGFGIDAFLRDFAVKLKFTLPQRARRFPIHRDRMQRVQWKRR